MSKKNRKITSNEPRKAEIVSEIGFQSPVVGLQIKPIWLLAGLTAAIFLTYSKIWGNGLVWDDDPYIKINDAVKNFDINALLTGFHVGNFHPLTMLTLAVEYAIVGESPWLYHFDNLILHAINSFLVYNLIKNLTAKDLVALFTAGFFALHPLHVESVAWAAERKDLLYTLFLLLSFLAYLRYNDSGKRLHYVLSLVFFLLSCLSKGMAVVLPALLIITDWWFLGKKLSVKNLIDKIPYFLITFLFAYIATTAQKDAGADASKVIGAAYNFSERLRFVSFSYMFYWVKTIFPKDLLPFYPYPGRPGGSIPGVYNFALFAFLLTGAVVWFIGRKNKWVWWAFAFFTIAISTVLQILPVGSALVADRYYYLSSIGPLFLISNLLLGKSGIQKSGKFIAAFLMLICMIISFFQVAHWKNGYTLFKPAEKFYPEDAMVLSNIGWYHLAEKDFPSAKQYLTRADNNGFKNADVCRTIGSMYIDEGQYETAITYIKRAYDYMPVKPRTDWLMALALSKLDRNAEALPYAQKASLQEPENLDYLNTLSQILSSTGNQTGAREINKKLMAQNPEFYDAWLNYAYTFRKEGNLDKEVEELKALIAKAPKYLPAYRNLGVTYAELGKNDEAVELWQRAAIIDSTGDYEYNIGINYALRNRINDAVPWYKKAAQKGKLEAIDILKKNGQTF